MGGTPSPEALMLFEHIAMSQAGDGPRVASARQRLAEATRRVDEAKPMRDLVAAGAVVGAWPVTKRGPKTKASGAEAKTVIEAFLKARGWKRDYRATKPVWINDDETRRVTFKRAVVVYEKGRRGQWERDYDVMPFGEPLSTIKYAALLYSRAQAATGGI